MTACESGLASHLSAISATLCVPSPCTWKVSETFEEAMEAEQEVLSLQKTYAEPFRKILAALLTKIAFEGSEELLPGT